MTGQKKIINMEKSFKIIVAFLLCFVSFLVKAQENNGDFISIPASMYDKFRSDLKVSRDSINCFVDSCAILNMQIKILEISNSNLKADSIKNQQLLEKTYTDISAKDSLIEVLNNKHKNDSLAIGYCNSKLLEMQALMDETSAKYANGRLYFKYDAERIKGCLTDYDQLKTQSVKEKFKQLPDLLRNYGNFSEQLKSILLSAQNDPDRKVRNKAGEYKSKYESEIRNSFYYSNYYSKKNIGIWSIPYLNNIIDIALSILQKHDPGHNDPVNFNSLIEML